MLTRSKENFRNKLILFFVIAMSIIVFLGTHRNLYYMDKFASEDFIQKVELNAQEKNLFFQEFFSRLTNSVSAIASNRLLVSSISSGDFLKSKAVFETFVNANKDYMQLRFLNEFGVEKIRCQRDGIGSKSYFVQPEQLQDKSNRYYYQLTKLLKPNQVWFSKIDLNMEHGMIEQPIKPVLRIISPVFVQGCFRGLVVINVFMKEFLENLTKSSMFNIYLIDGVGNFLIHKDPKHNWSGYSSNPYGLAGEFGSLTGKILESEHANPMPNSKLYVKELGIGAFKNYKLIFQQNEEVLKKNGLASIKMGLFIGFIAILLAFPAGYILSIPFNRVYEELQQKTMELEEVAHNLEERVQEEIAQNSLKEQMLMHQSKLASMGEMIGNIAHQWRQPLTRLSLIIQNISIAHERNMLSKTLMHKTEKNALSQIEMMSNTIDDFRDFFLPNREKKSFDIKSSIKEALQLHITSFDHNAIKLHVDFADAMVVNGYKSEFAQVLFNLLNNSKDAFIQNSIENRKIKIKTYGVDNNAIIEVEDNAGGISDALLDKIFEPYFTTKFKHEGTGIGLYMSKMIVEKHMEGSLFATNTEDGVRFTIKIPMV